MTIHKTSNDNIHIKCTNRTENIIQNECIHGYTKWYWYIVVGNYILLCTNTFLGIWYGI